MIRPNRCSIIVGQHRFVTRKRLVRFDVDHLLPHRERHVDEQRDRVDAGVVDEDVDLAAAIGTHPLDHLGRPALRRSHRTHREGAAAARRDACGNSCAPCSFCLRRRGRALLAYASAIPRPIPLVHR